MLSLSLGATAAFGADIGETSEYGDPLDGGQLGEHPVKLAPVRAPVTFSR